MVGRDDELELVESLLRHRATSGVVLTGEAGVGKTRLAAECLERAERHGFATARVLATRAASAVPLGAVAPLLPPAGEQFGPIGVLQWAVDEVAALGGDRPLAVFVDDAHLLDEMSAGLVLRLAMERLVFVIVSVRSGEAAPDAIVALWKDAIAERIDLAPLGPDEVERLLTAALDGPVDGAVVQRLYELSRGNALYLRELVRAGLDGGALSRESGPWRLSGAFLVSPQLAELIGDRLRGLDPVEREVLELIAYGGRLSVALLERNHRPAVLERLEVLGLVVAEADGRRLEARLSHPIYGEVLHAQTPPLRARRIHRTLGEWIAATGARRLEDTLRVGTHLLSAGGSAPPDLMLRAAQAARRHEDLDLAERLARASAESGAGFDAGLLLAQLALLRGHPLEAETRFAELTELATDDGQRTAVAHSRIDNLLIGLGRPDEAMRVADRIRESMTDPATLDAMTARMSSVLFVAGRTREAIVILEPLFDRAEGVALVEACTIGSMSLAQAGRVDRAIEIGERGRSAHIRLRGPPRTFGTHVGLLGAAQALILSGRLREAEQFVGGEYHRATSTGEGEAQASWAQFMSLIHLAQGRVVTAIRYGNEAVALYRERHWAPHLRRSLGVVVHALALSGDADAARAALQEMDALEMTSAVALALEMESRAWVDIAHGEITSGAQLLRDAVEVAFDRGDLAYAAAILHSLVRIGVDVESSAERLASLCEGVEGPLMQVRADHAAAAAAKDVYGLETGSRRYEELGALLFAAETSAAAAVALRHAGDPRRAAGAERRAAELARRCEGAMTPALRAIESQALLTARELEVAGMAAAGLANREIAERLSLSVRTVETQLQRVYEKLGVRKRAELSDALELSGSDT